MYQGALRKLGQTKLSSLTEDREERHNLDGVWNENARDDCLEMGNWNFATRTSKLEYDSSIDPDFGFQRAFVKPTDWVRSIQISSDEFFTNPLVDREYVDEQGYFFASIDSLYIRYVSSDASYGYDLSLWPRSFSKYVEYFLADAIAPNLHLDQDNLDKMTERMEDALTMALSKDALNEGIKFPPPTSWNRARRGSRTRSDLGSRSRLIG